MLPLHVSIKMRRADDDQGNSQWTRGQSGHVEFEIKCATFESPGRHRGHQRRCWKLCRFVLLLLVLTIRDQAVAEAEAEADNLASNRLMDWYSAPSGYDSQKWLSGGGGSPNTMNVPRSFIVTSRPLIFTPDKDGANPQKILNGGINSKKGAATSTKVHFIPGLAKVVCKGKTCATASPPDQLADDDDSAFTSGGFPGEAIPIVTDDEYAATLMFHAFADHPQYAPYDHTSSSRPYGSDPATVTRVNLLTHRPYLVGGYGNVPLWQRLTTTKMTTPKVTKTKAISTTTTTTTSTTKKRRTSRRTTTRLPRPSTTTTTKKPKLALLSSADSSSSSLLSSSSADKQDSATTTLKPRRPASFIIPAVAAFSLMAIPVAAVAAAPFFLGRKKRRRRDVIWPSKDIVLGPHFEDTPSELEADADDLHADLEDLRNEKFPPQWRLLVEQKVRQASALLAAKIRGPHGGTVAQLREQLYTTVKTTRPEALLSSATNQERPLQFDLPASTTARITVATTKRPIPRDIARLRLTR